MSNDRTLQKPLLQISAGFGMLHHIFIPPIFTPSRFDADGSRLVMLSGYLYGHLKFSVCR